MDSKDLYFTLSDIKIVFFIITFLGVDLTKSSIFFISHSKSFYEVVLSRVLCILARQTLRKSSLAVVMGLLFIIFARMCSNENL